MTDNYSYTPLLEGVDFGDPRLKAIEGDFWIGYDAANAALAKMEYFFQKPQRNRPLNLALIGNTNNGKSMILDRFYRLHKPIRDLKNDNFQRPALVIEQPSVPDEKRLYNEILSALGSSVRNTDSIESRLHTVLVICKNLHTRVLIIDEFHKMLAGSVTRQKQHLNAIRSLCNQLKIPVIVAGTEDVRNALNADPQLANRFETIRLKKWQYDKDFLRLLISLEKVFKLDQKSNLADPKIAKKILALSEGTIGEIVNLLRSAAVHAILTGDEIITPNTLEKIDWIVPSKRHREG